MKNKKKYILKRSAFKFKMPVIDLVVCWLLLDRTNAPDLVFGGFYFLLIIVFISWLYYFAITDEIEVDIQKLLKQHYLDTKQNEEVEEP